MFFKKNTRIKMDSLLKTKKYKRTPNSLKLLRDVSKESSSTHPFISKEKRVTDKNLGVP
jgi:hypothetical protein